ncbi:MAG: divalent-cation tolerance protein CutA [Candidatus Dasytiphilus stammeri]
MKISKLVIILCTVPNEDWALKLSKKFLDERLAACITQFKNATSLYYWKGEIKQTQEVQMLIKTDSIHQYKLMRLLKDMHPYETPELLALTVQYVDKQYHSWLTNLLQ